MSRKVMGELEGFPLDENADSPEILILAPARIPYSPLESEYVIQIKLNGIYQVPISQVAALVLSGKDRE